MKTGTKKYFEQVMQEIEGIKKNATQEEISKLNLDSLDADHYKRCIYGQMTGDCFSERSDFLIGECCLSLSANSINEKFEIEKSIPRTGEDNNFTLLEHCIAQYPNNNENIIAYLKGEINSLTLTKA